MKTLLPKFLLSTLILILSTFFVKASCSASFTKSISGLTVSFTNTSTSSAGLSNVHYSWYFSNGQSSTLANPTTTYLSPGMQVAQLTMYDSSTHCSSFFMDSIFVTTPTSSCAAIFLKSATGNTVVLTNMSTNTSGIAAGLSYYWYFSDGTSSTLKDPTKVFATNGLKTISLTITDSSQGCYSTRVDSVMLPSGCAPSFSTSVSGLTVTFNNTSVNGDGTANGLTYQWHFTHDNSNYTSKNITKTFPSIGYWPVRLTISDPSQGCSKMLHDTVYLSSSSSCAANFTESVSAQTITFTNTSLNTNGSSSGLSYYWYFSDGTSSTLKNPVKTFTSGGLKTITLTITDSLQGCFSSKTDSIILANTSCYAMFSQTISGLTVSLTNYSLNSNGSSAGLSYYWYFSDGTSSTLKDPVKTFTTPGYKTIHLTISDSAQGCFSSTMDTAVLTPSPVLCQASFSLATDTAQPFHFYILNTSTIRSSSTFFWDFGDGTSSTLMTPSHTYANFGYYFVCLSVFDSICSSTFCDSIGMDSNGVLLKQGAFGFETLDFTTVSTATAIRELNKTPEYTIYPNPSNGNVFIDYTFQSEAPLTIEVTDITGKVVKNKHTTGLSGKHTETIDIADLQPAIYFMTIRSADMQKNYKLIKN